MGVRGRQSSVSRTTLTVFEVKRPDPPAELTEAEKGIWRSVVSATPAGWFSKATFPLLVSYCRHIARAALLAHEIERWLPEWLTVDGGTERFERLLRMADREDRAALAAARALRLTPQSQIRATGAGTAFKAVRGRRPWQTDEERLAMEDELEHEAE